MYNGRFRLWCDYNFKPLCSSILWSQVRRPILRIAASALHVIWHHRPTRYCGYSKLWSFTSAAALYIDAKSWAFGWLLPYDYAQNLVLRIFYNVLCMRKWKTDLQLRLVIYGEVYYCQNLHFLFYSGFWKIQSTTKLVARTSRPSNLQPCHKTKSVSL